MERSRLALQPGERNTARRWDPILKLVVGFAGLVCFPVGIQPDDQEAVYDLWWHGRVTDTWQIV
jgi:hypothetical protein